ncbi:helix-turn-helix domain-containing protein [Nocardia terpenica]|uniref:Helix-turn-helix domain-containing protein n=1 Tax=Nocardia terpenica TaxID=455432 RepID=A0A6G9ZCT8_9NOCA|nr:helix-turn-helix transcriptional regulator [Nocardia terpenica]QIS23425.1 helix-turn-helix domain-containing protein [Nocardia terpenica]
MGSMDESSWLRHGAERDSAQRVGALVREYRLASGRNQAAVAAALGVTQQFLSQVETGKRNVTLEHRQGFAQVLGIPLEELGLAGPRRGSSVSDGTTAAVAASRGRWRVQRHWLNQHRAELGRVAAQWYASDYRVPRTSLIAGDGWLPWAPVELGTVRLRLYEGPQSVRVTGTEAETLAVRPLRTPDAVFASYSSALKHLDPPQLFESRPSYRYLGGTLSSGVLDFGLAAYFDKLDVSEALAHELAAVCMDLGSCSVPNLQGCLPFRELVGDPFDPAGRAVVPAITTLTIRLRRYPAAPSFLLHWRDPERVATAAGVYDVIPAGEFQPSSVALWDRHKDFSLWRNMVREFAEELLGQPEHDGSRSEPIDYERWPLYQRLETARQEGRLTACVLGIGLDALTLAATILTVVVIDDEVFDEVFGATVRFNEEGEVVASGGGQAADGVPFTAAAIERLLETEPVAAPGAACLALAWQHRHSLIS